MGSRLRWELYEVSTRGNRPGIRLNGRDSRRRSIGTAWAPSIEVLLLKMNVAKS